MNSIIEKLQDYKKEESIEGLKKRYHNLLQHIESGSGCYIFGTGMLGNFCAEQMKKNNIHLNGYVDNDPSRWDVEREVYSPTQLTKDDVVIIASFYHLQIAMQLKNLGIELVIYYEELAYIMAGFATYYEGFEDIFGELETNKKEYIDIFHLLRDDISEEVYRNLLEYRMTLDCRYTLAASELSSKQGIQDFDKLVVDHFTGETCFYDVGGYDGQSTLDFIRYAAEYQKIFFFEPDKDIIENTAKRLREYRNIEYLPLAIGDKEAEIHYDNSGGGGGRVCKNGNQIVKMKRLDDFIFSGESYVKIDVEGFELSVLNGCEKAIRNYKPMLSVSLYHKAGDIHRLIHKVLEWNPNYKLYMRHYTGTYADTRAYFVADSC